ncbi:MAG: 50S ribosomal protein L18 [Candidatus Levybacteria bacterium RIFCSPLOWO2_02_FULL_37_10]|nr:MAG: 50S ribosomal protein L18 [Candidatus Levybacteria bacterium RIFCSPHIGHO2_01_FULL_37_33]OGH17508.1 MAG: 50S ribosomal protein L18 [Candidatus Levybacteria bacterium RIFCSPHIGHO2_02_FULL_37_11]OGH29420.1 MAG: 50S ribosomal protein L18 [Candidatus Levybacteria bacterium RIFCSPHIGHO2_12_FULL_37_12]OGH32928.1 MAG: 50S ribosomal protein L18 [Candidatus Levybacteria bacterium RIFCSPLOWO2_01_FULL_36_54]OGH43309.1 MAG: 50S ribosomal protein L18 [Candidatus Levybacteria bacterium RIFCSPLOWO2_02_
MNKIGREIKRKIRVRSKVKGTCARPRLSVHRSNKFIYAQLIDDDKAETILGVSEKNLGKEIKGKKSDKARELGLLLAKLAISKKINTAVFDRGSYAYHGRIKQVAQGAREGGLKF